MPCVDGAIGFDNGLLQGTTRFGERARIASLGGDIALSRKLGDDWAREGRVSANPVTLDCAHYLAGCMAAERKEADPSSGFGVGMVDTPAWGHPISIEDDAAGATVESTRATLVAFTPDDEPAGHICLNFSVWTNRNDDRVLLYTDVVIVYIRPRHRGRAYGVDLCVAGGKVTSGIVDTVLAAVPDGGSFRFTGMAEYLSEGGARVCRAIWAAAEATQASCLAADGPRLRIEPAVIHVR